MARSKFRPLVPALIVILLALPSIAPAASARELSGPTPEIAPLVRELPAAIERTLAPAPARETAAWDTPGHLVVGLEGDALASASVIDALAALHGGRVTRVDTTLGFATVQIEPASEPLFLKAARASPLVSYAHRDAIMRASFTPNDTRYGEQWGPAPINMPLAWNTTLGDHNVTVGILDTGVDLAHPDLADNDCGSGPDYANGDSNSTDDHGHGTHVAGTVGASIDNALGVAGMANACLVAVKVLDGSGSGQFSWLASALVWSADNGIDIVSMSLGGCPGCDPGEPLTSAVAYAASHNVHMIAAAGNAGCAPVSYPAAYSDVLAVAALVSPGNTTAGFSSCGDEVLIAAPGDSILSTSLTSGPLSDPSGYMMLSGTSMATPHVSGVAALVLSQHPALTPSDLRCLLAETAVDIMAVGHDVNSGFGRIDAAAALAQGECIPQAPGPATLRGATGANASYLAWNQPGVIGGAISGYELYRGPNETALSLLVELPASARSYVDTNVTDGDAYTYVVRALSSVGPGVASNAVVVTPLAPAPLPVSFNVENGTTGWSMDGLWHVTEDRSQSAPNSFYFGIENGPGLEDNTYNTGRIERGSLVTPPIDLAGETQASLLFWHHFEGEGNNYEHPIVQVSTQGPFGPWTTVYEDASQSGERVAGATLSAYLGQSIQVRFRWDTVDAWVNHFEGWYVDDLLITSEDLPIICDTESDSYGYTCSVVAFDFQDISATGTPLYLGDDSLSAPIALPFDVVYYGATHGALLVSSNGFVTFDTTTTASGCCSGQPIPYNVQPNTMIAGYWTDLYAAGGSVHYATVGDAPDRAFIVQYTGVPICCDPAAPTNNTFQIKIFENDTIEAHYLNAASYSSSATAGIEDCTGARGIQFGYGALSYANVAVRYTPPFTGLACTVPTPNTPPTVSIVAPQYGETISGNYLAYGTANDADLNDSIAAVYVYVDGLGSIANGTENWSFVIAADSLTSGWHLLEAYAIDTAGAGSWTSVSFYIEGGGNAPPTASFTSPPEGTTIAGWTNVSGLSMDEDGPIMGLNVWINGATLTQPIQYSADAWSFSFDTTSYPNGPILIEAQAFDAYSNGPVATLNLTIQNDVGNTHPYSGFYSPADGSTIAGNTYVSGYAYDVDANDSIVEVAVSVDGNFAWYQVNGTNSWDMWLNTTTLADNSWHTLDVYASDQTSWWFGQRIYVLVQNGGVPNTAPNVTIASPCAGCATSGALYISGNAWDNDAGDMVEAVHFSVDGAPYGLANGTTSWYAILNTTNLANGWHTLGVVANDGAITSEPTTVAFHVDNSAPNTPPTVRIGAPVAGERVEGRVLVQGSAADADAGDAIVAIQARIDHGDWFSVGSGESWAFYWNTAPYANGPHSIEVMSFDGEDASAIATVTVEVDNPQAPTVMIAGPQHGQYVSGVTYLWGVASARDPAALLVEVRVDGGEWRPAAGTTSWSRYLDTRELENGIHDIEARASDGTLVSPTQLVQVHVHNDDSLPPAIVIDSPEGDSDVQGMLVVRGRTFDPDGDARYVQYSVNGDWWRTAMGVTDWNFNVDTRLVYDGWHSISVRVFDAEGHADYAFVYVYVDNRPDLRITSFSETRGTLVTDAGSAPNPIGPRELTFTLVNDGGRTAHWVPVIVYSFVTTPNDITMGDIACEQVADAIEPGASVTMTCMWDPKSYAGDVLLVARADPYHEIDERLKNNNAASLRTYVGAGGTGTGLHVYEFV